MFSQLLREKGLLTLEVPAELEQALDFLVPVAAVGPVAETPSLAEGITGPVTFKRLSAAGPAVQEGVRVGSGTIPGVFLEHGARV